MDNPGISLFQASGINIDNPLHNQEEDEDLEEQKRRQEEIQNFLTTAMDEFNYDDQSTVNSSTNVSVDDHCNTQNNIVDKYKNASLDDQLKVLYEIRVREVQTLTEELEQLKADIGKQKQLNGKTNLLLEAEKDKAKISSQQAQQLLVNKTEKISELQNEIDTLRATVLSLEATVKGVNDEYTLCKQSNKELIDQLSLMHNGLTTNTISDRQLQEQHHTEISHLHHLLDNSNMKLHRKEKEYKELEQKLRDTANDRDMIMTEKSSIINQLSQNLENALDRCQEFSQIIEKLSQENKTLKLSTTTSEITDSIRNMGLFDKTEIVKALQKELEKTQEIQIKQQLNYEELQETCKKLSRDCKTYENSSEEYKNEVDTWKKKYEKLNDDLVKSNEALNKLQPQLEEHRKKSVAESMVYENRIKLLQESLKTYESKQSQDNSVQISNLTHNLMIEKEENHKLNSKIETLNEEIKLLNQKLSESENHVSQMKWAVSLGKERENLIKSLQEKAVKFEEIIKRRQTTPECSSVAVNTDPVASVENESDREHLLKTKFETDLIQKEIEIRREVKTDFDLKFERIQKELSKKIFPLRERSCENCEELSNDLKRAQALVDAKDEDANHLRQRMKQDREAVATLLEGWGDKFVQMETEKKELYTECANLKETCDLLVSKLKTREVGDSKLYEVIKRECEETIKMWNKNTLENLHQYTQAQQKRVQQSNIKIEEFSKNADMEVQAIEMQYLQKKQSFEHKRPHKKQYST